MIPEQPIASLEQMVDLVRARHCPVRVVVAACADVNAALAALEAFRQGLAVPIFIGDMDKMRALSELGDTPLTDFTCVHEPDVNAALRTALAAIESGEADFLMKGEVRTDTLLRAVLHTKGGKKGLLSHIGVFPHPHEKRLLLVTDAAVNIAPSLTRKIDIIKNAAAVAEKLGMHPPKIAVLSATEKVSYNEMVASKDADILAKLSHMGIFGQTIVGGPFALDIAVSATKARIKGVHDPVAGHADILFAPNIVAGNILYKSVTSLLDLPMAGIVTGGGFPLVVPSRGDSDRSKFFSLALAAFLAQRPSAD